MYSNEGMGYPWQFYTKIVLFMQLATGFKRDSVTRYPLQVLYICINVPTELFIRLSFRFRGDIRDFLKTTRCIHMQQGVKFKIHEFEAQNM
jgi:hypothetical protein